MRKCSWIGEVRDNFQPNDEFEVEFELNGDH